MQEPQQRVLRWTGPGELAMGSAAVPKAGPGEIVLSVHACGICGSDLHLWKDNTLPPGSVMGHEFVGHVVDIGTEVDGIQMGDRVVANPMGGGIGLGFTDGAFADYVRVPGAVIGKTVFRVPPEMPDEIAALVEPLAVGLHANNIAGAKPDDKVIIFGAGTIGLCVLAGLHARGVRDVIMCEPSPLRRERALAMGATAVFDPAGGSTLLAFVESQFGRPDRNSFLRVHGNCDIAFDCAGVPAALDGALTSLRHLGKMVLVAAFGGHMRFDLRSVLLGEITVAGVLAYEDEFADAIGLLSSKAVDLQPLITHQMLLDDAPEAFILQARSNETVKVIIRPQPSA